MGYLGITLYYESNGPVNALVEALGGRGIPGSPARPGAGGGDDHRYLAMGPLRVSGGPGRLQGLPRTCTRRPGGWRLRLPAFPVHHPAADGPILWLILLLRMIEASRCSNPMSLTLGAPAGRPKCIVCYLPDGAAVLDHGYAAAQGFLLLVIVSIIISILYGRIRDLYEFSR